MRRRLASLVAGVALLGLAGGACDDSALNELGAPGALQKTVEVRLGDFWLAPAGGEPVAPGGFFARIVPHNDVTFVVTNEGSVPHALTVYASESGGDILVSTPRIEPGASAEVRFHFHDAMTVLLRDDAYPAEMSALLVVVEG
jgi:hypothetical protein